MKLNKKVVSISLAAAMAVSMVPAVSASAEETIPTLDQIKVGEDYQDLTASIKVLTNRTDIVDTVYKGYAEEFMELYPNIQVEYEGITDYGFSREVSKEEFEERIRNHTLTEVLNKVEIHKGDVLFIDPGTIHAIGAGCLIAEIQQNSNVTYRVYDYGRKGVDGKERELHVDKALQVTKREPVVKNKDVGLHVETCQYFTVDKVILDGLRRKKLTGEADASSFVSVLMLNGQGKISACGETLDVKKGDSIFITAGSGEYQMEGEMEALLTTV